MSIKILTKNSIDNTNIDGARQNHFSAGMRSGIVKGAFNEGRFFASASNVIALDSCELRISGHQIVVDSIEAITLSDRPSVPTKYSMIAEIQVSDMSVPSFRLFIQPASVGLRQENLFKTNNGSGTYQLRIGNFTLGTTGLISDVVRTADIITGGGEGGIADIKFNATATQLSSSSQPEVNADYNEETKEWDLNFGIPAGSGSRVTIGGVEQPTWSADFAESERQKSKNLWAYGDVSGTKVKDIILEQPLPIGTYTMSYVAESADTDSSKCLIEFYDENEKYISGNNVERNKRENILKKFTVPVGRISFYASPTFAGGTNDTFTFSNIQIEEGEVATDYQPYNGAIVHEKDIQRHIITGHLLADYNPGTTNYTVIPLVQYSKIGNKLTMNSNGGVVVGTGVTNVMVSAGVGIYVANVGYHYISIYKNNKMIATEYVQTKDTSGRNITFSISRFLLPVSEGDIITFEFKDSAGNGLQSADLQTQMTVEVVE